jgi:hypothetical protein
MKSIIATIAVILLTAFSASESHAEKCYWTGCNANCVAGKTTMFTRVIPTNRTRDCKQRFCCSAQVSKKLKKDDGYMCRAKCASKPNGGPYFKCMDKCLGRTR